MDCILCGEYQRKRSLHPTTYARPRDHYRANGIPEPIIQFGAIPNTRTVELYGRPFAGRGEAPGDRAPLQTDAKGGKRPGTPSWGLDQFARRPVTMTSPIGPTDQVNPFTRTQAEGGSLRWVREQYVIPGGPAGAAQGLFGNVHNTTYMTIADTMKPAQQLPVYNLASVDVQGLADKARRSLLRTLYGVG